MDDYTREMMDLKTLVTRTLEKKGVLAKIRVKISQLSLLCQRFCRTNSNSKPSEMCPCAGFLAEQPRLRIWLSSDRVY